MGEAPRPAAHVEEPAARMRRGGRNRRNARGRSNVPAEMPDEGQREMEME